MHRRLTLLPLASLVAALGLAAGAYAQNPPSPPTFAYLYGRITAGGADVAPASQPVLAFINGQSCVALPGETLIAEEGEDVPEGDVGRTVYVVDVLAHGLNNYERDGCGQPGTPILLYLPVTGRMSSQQPLFQAGPTRVDLEMDVNLTYRARAPQLAADGSE